MAGTRISIILLRSTKSKWDKSKLKKGVYDINLENDRYPDFYNIITMNGVKMGQIPN